MVFFILVGALSLITGILFILAPDLLRSINEKTARLITSIDSAVFAYRAGLGIVFIVASILFFFVAYYIKSKG